MLSGSQPGIVFCTKTHLKHINIFNLFSVENEEAVDNEEEIYLRKCHRGRRAS